MLELLFGGGHHVALEGALFSLLGVGVLAEVRHAVLLRVLQARGSRRLGAPEEARRPLAHRLRVLDAGRACEHPLRRCLHSLILGQFEGEPGHFLELGRRVVSRLGLGQRRGVVSRISSQRGRAFALMRREKSAIGARRSRRVRCARARKYDEQRREQLEGPRHVSVRSPRQTETVAEPEAKE